MITKTVEISEYEFERGKPMPSLQHAGIQSNILVQLHLKYSTEYQILSESNIELNGELFVPDLSIFKKFNINYNEVNIRYNKPPLLAIEILSPTQSVVDLIVKMKKMIDNGVKSYWLVEPSTKTIFVFNHKKEQTTFISGLIIDKELDISIDMSEIFA